MSRQPLGNLVLPYDSLRTLANSGAEVRLYLNTITQTKQVGKRVDLLGHPSMSYHEATLLQTISHDNLVPVLDVAQVMEYAAPMNVIELIMPHYARGSACDALLRGERFSIATAVVLTQQALRGLGELHDVHRIIHRDVKSPNVFLCDDGTLRVGDLGAAVPMDDSGQAEPYPSLQPTTPPETYVASRIGRSYDIFGVGVVLFELLCGPLPYPYDEQENRRRLGKGQLAIPARHLTFCPSVPPRLRTVVRKALARDPSDRYQTVAEMARAIAGAPYIDWAPPLAGDAHVLWEGTLATRPDRRFQVEARRRRNGAWLLSGRQRLTSWRRFVEDRIVPDPQGAPAADFFDHILSAAINS